MRRDVDLSDAKFAELTDDQFHNRFVADRKHGANAKIDNLIVTNTIPLNDVVRRDLPMVKVLSVAKLLGEAINRIHSNQSVSALFMNGA